MGKLSLLDWVLLGFFVSHIPITILFDSQAILPSHFYPEFAINLLDWYAVEFSDPYMIIPAPSPKWWFLSFVGCEILLQLPFFFVATYGIYTQASWLKAPGIMYGAHVCTTVVPIIVELLKGEFEPGMGPQTEKERWTLVGIYCPYFILPFMFLIKCIQMPAPTRAETKATQKQAKSKKS